MYLNEEAKKQTKIGLKQGYVLSPLLWYVFIDETVKNYVEKCNSVTVRCGKMKSMTVEEKLFADDILLIAESKKTLKPIQTKYVRK